MAARLPLALLLTVLAAGPAAAQARMDRVGDPLPAGALYRIGTDRLQLGVSVRGVALAPDGKLVAAAGGAPFAVWETASGRELFRASSRRGSMRACIVWAPDGKSLVVNYEWRLCLFDVPTRKIRQWLGGEALCAAFSKDGRSLTVVQRDEGHRAPTVRRWDLAAGKSLTQWQYPAQPKAKGTDDIFEPWLSLDGERLALLRVDQAAKQQWMQIYDAATGHSLQHSSRDEDLHARGERADGARPGQQPGAGAKNPLVAEVIGQGASGQQGAQGAEKAKK